MAASDADAVAAHVLLRDPELELDLGVLGAEAEERGAGEGARYGGLRAHVHPARTGGAVRC